MTQTSSSKYANFDWLATSRASTSRFVDGEKQPVFYKFPAAVGERSVLAKTYISVLYNLNRELRGIPQSILIVSQRTPDNADDSMCSLPACLRNKFIYKASSSNAI